MAKDSAETIMSKAKIQLLLTQPFFGSIVCNLPWTENNNFPTMATNGKEIFWNRKFVESLSAQEVMFVQAHEVLHCALRHLIRLGDKDMKIWNFATDYVINDMLHEEKCGKMPQGALYDRALVERHNYDPEKIYKELLEQSIKGVGPSGSGIDELIAFPGGEAEQSQQEADMRVLVAQAANVAKAQGKLSAGLKRFADLANKSKVDWRTIMRQFAMNFIKEDRSFAKLSRHMAAVAAEEDLLFPGMDGDACGPIVLAIDCSGSIGNEELKQFGGEGKVIHEECKPEKMHVLYFDHDIAHHDEFDPDDTFGVNAHGGGGTSFSCIFRFIKEKQLEPVGVIVLTDMYCTDFGDPPPCPVLWISTTTQNPEPMGPTPFGQVIPMDLD